MTFTTYPDRIMTRNEQLGWSPIIEEGGTFVVEQRRCENGCFQLMTLCDNRAAAEARIREALVDHPEHTIDDYRLSIWTVLSEWPDTADDTVSERVPK
jgi:hypothetical protein